MNITNIRIIPERIIVSGRCFFIAFFLFFAVFSYGQEEEMPKRTVSISAGLNNNQSWEVEPSVTYYFCKFLGATLGLNVTNQYNQVGYSGSVIGNSELYWEIEDGDANVAKFLIRPAISLRTPVLWLNKDHDTGLTIGIEPGLFVALPSNDEITVNYRDKAHGSIIIGSKRLSNTKGDWLFWNLRGIISLNVDRFIISTGYSISNFDIYSGRRNIIVENMKLNNKLPIREYTYSSFLSLGYYF